MLDIIYDSLNKVLTYYDFKFMSNYIFLTIIFINSFKAFFRYREIVISGIQFKGFVKSEVLISIISLVGIFSEVYFQKTLYDIFSYYNKYNSSINYIALISFLLFLVQLFFLFKCNQLSYKKN